MATGGRVALCQIVRAEGSTPGRLGWKLSVLSDGSTVGNLGGGSFEALVVADARGALARPGASAEVKRYYLTEEAARGEPTGMVCGGFAEVLIEVVTARPLLLICGGGPVGQAVAESASLCDFEPCVIDDRPEFREAELFPPGTVRYERVEDLASEDAGALGERPLYVVVVSRCWETDTASLDALLRMRRERAVAPLYVGLMGSRRKVARVRTELESRGHRLDDLELHAPIGLPIGAETPAEIAVSILAEIIRSRRSPAGSSSAGEPRAS